MNNTILILRRSFKCRLCTLRRPYSSELIVEGERTEDVLVPPEIVPERPPVILSRPLTYLPKSIKPRLAWVENLDTLNEHKLGLVDLHPDVWGTMPRVDIISQNIRWQRMYKFVDYRWLPTRAEMAGGGRKPWPQKGTGRARHGSVRSPLFLNGGICHGPRGPTSYFYMLPYYSRIIGLTSTLSIKLAQDDLHIVDSLEIPTDKPQYLEDLVKERNWGVSVLFVDVPDLMPTNISLACEEVKHMNLMPAYGLNVYSMLKHETLVLTTAAVDHIEERLLFALNCTDSREKTKKFRIDMQ